MSSVFLYTNLSLDLHPPDPEQEMDICRLIKNLHKQDWQSQGCLDKVVNLLNTLWSAGKTKTSIADLLQRCEYPDPAVTRTAELHSWKLHRTTHWDLTLNQFLPYGDNHTVSENIHNHTRPLVSLTLEGGYTQDYYRPVKPLHEFKVGDHWCGQLQRYPGPTTTPGTVYVTDVNVLHALTSFLPDTMTLVVYGPIRQNHITCFNQFTKRVERRVTVTDAKRRLINALRGHHHNG